MPDMLSLVRALESDSLEETVECLEKLKREESVENAKFYLRLAFKLIEEKKKTKQTDTNLGLESNQ